MIKGGFRRIIDAAKGRMFSTKGRIQYIEGNSQLCEQAKDVQLRGIRIQGNFEDLPNLIFFPDLFDQVENWVPYFTNKSSSILDYRNVYLLYPRNFGTSDWSNDKNDEYAENTVADIERFMFQHKITMATLGGHGFGAKNAMVVGTFRPELVTGIFAYNYAPQDYTYFRPAATLREVAKKLADLDGKPFSKQTFDKIVEGTVQCKKTQKILQQNLKQQNAKEFGLRYNSKFIGEQFEELVNWKSIPYGLYGGRSSFIFPEFSHHVFLGSNTNSMMKVCVQNNGFFRDIHNVQCESDNPESNHWIYEQPELIDAFQHKTLDFLSKYDGVDVRYMNKQELVEKFAVPVRSGQDRVDRYAGDYVPSHFHHNWKFTDRPELK